MDSPDFKCSYCSKTFTKKFCLLRHVEDIHKKRQTFKCKRCGKQFGRKDNLKRHESTHTNEVEHAKKKSNVQVQQLNSRMIRVTKRTYECDHCGLKLTKKHNLIRHIRHHTSPQTFECATCGRLYVSKWALSQHIRLVHMTRKKLVSRFSSTLICTICELSFPQRNGLFKHYSESHNIELKFEKKEFDSLEEFENWKKELEFSTTTSYISSRGLLNKPNCLIRKMNCHRSGLFASKVDLQKRKRKQKKKGTKKIQGVCPAEITVEQSKSDGKCHVIMQSTHVGHDVSNTNQLQHIYLDKSKKFDLGGQIAAGIPHMQVLENEINALTSGSRDNRKQNVSKFDIRNIKYKYAAEKYPQKDDVINIAAFVENNKDSILYFKNKNDDNVSSTLLEETHPFQHEDFVLVYMNKEQKESIQLFANDRVVGFDGTHGTNPYKYLLHTMMVQNFNQEGVPGAFLITNRNDETVLTCFFLCIKQQVGELLVKTIISDMQMSYYNAWVKVMPEPQFFLFCTWHVDQAWLRHYPKFNKDTSKLETFKTTLRNLQLELDENKFELLLDEFINQPDPELSEFLKYFVSNYVGKTHHWAYCWRKFAQINTNMLLESFHKHFKYDGMGLKGLKPKSLASCLYGLKKYIDHLLREEKNKLIYGHNPGKLVKLNNRHAAAANDYGKFRIEAPCNDADWRIISCESMNIYTIQKLDPVCKNNCLLICDECNACLHMYRCSCFDNSIKYNMCKHIHVLLSFHESDEASSICSESEPLSSTSSPIFNPESLSRIAEMILSKVKKAADLKRDCKRISESIFNRNLSFTQWSIYREALLSASAKIDALSKINTHQHQNAEIDTPQGQVTRGCFAKQKRSFSNRKKSAKSN